MDIPLQIKRGRSPISEVSAEETAFSLGSCCEWSRSPSLNSELKEYKQRVGFSEVANEILSLQISELSRKYLQASGRWRSECHLYCWPHSIRYPLQYSGLEKFHGLYSPWGLKESETTERLSRPVTSHHSIRKCGWNLWLSNWVFTSCLTLSSETRS